LPAPNCGAATSRTLGPHCRECPLPILRGQVRVAPDARVESTLRQLQRLEAVGQLTSGMAHDFNSLLTVVLGNITFLEKGTRCCPSRGASSWNRR